MRIIFNLKHKYALLYTGSASESGDLATAFFYFYSERKRRLMLPDGVSMNSVLFEMESWTSAQGDFAVKSFYKNNDSYVAAQREFRKKFGSHRISKVPSAHAIKTWVNNFEETGSAVKRKGGSAKTVRTPQNIDAVRASFEQSPSRSAVRHSKKLGLSESSVRRILHLDLQCGYRKRFQESRSMCYLGPCVVFTIGLLSVSSVMDGT